MKYVIKGRWECISYVQFATPSFSFTSSLSEARQFPTIEAAIDAIVDRQRDLDKGFYRSNDKHTIVGIKEVSTPRYEEVVL